MFYLLDYGSADLLFWKSEINILFPISLFAPFFIFRDQEIAAFLKRRHRNFLVFLKKKVIRQIFLNFII